MVRLHARAQRPEQRRNRQRRKHHHQRILALTGQSAEDALQHQHAAEVRQRQQPVSAE